MVDNGGTSSNHSAGLLVEVEPQWVEVDLKRIAVERKRPVEGPWHG